MDGLIPGEPHYGYRDFQLHFEEPRVLWDKEDWRSTKYRINLDARPPYWLQLAYQCGHESAHVKMGPARSNLQLETFAEAVTLESNKRLRHHWRDNPPFGKSKDWKSLTFEELPKYRLSLIERLLKRIPQDVARPKALDSRNKIEWLCEHRTKVNSLPLKDNLSRAWQHLAASILVEDILTNGIGSWHTFLDIALQTDPSPDQDPRYRDDLPLLTTAIPDWVPEWLR